VSKSYFKLCGKSILLFSPTFFGYEKRIKESLIEMGAIVVSYDERPSNSSLAKFLIRINSKILKNKTNKYYDEIIERESAKKFA